MVDQRCLAGMVQIVGTSIIVGRRIFSIVEDLGFGVGLFRGYGQWQRVVRGRRLLHRLRKPGEVWGRLKSWRS